MALERYREAANLQKQLLRVVRRCAANFVKGSPPEPCEEVTELLLSLGMTKRHLQEIYDVFHRLREIEVEGAEIVVDALEIDRETMKHLIPTRRKWVFRLLMRLMQLGECDDQIHWDSFLYVLLHFCSLNRIELAQTMFLIIVKGTGRDVEHYLTALELQQFYWFYRECPVKAFNTKAIDFDLMPLSRYYPSDFTELTARFTCLLNPLLHLQQTLQSIMPDSAFWDTLDRTSTFVRKIHMEFFSMEEDRVHLYGEPPFRETCDILVPDALGAVPVNKQQWIMRTAGLNYGYGLRQTSVWGEQITPEIIEVQEAAYQKWKAQEVAQRKAEVAAAAAEANGSMLAPPGSTKSQAWQAGGGAPDAKNGSAGPSSPKDNKAASASSAKDLKSQGKRNPREFAAEDPEWASKEIGPALPSAAPFLKAGLDPTELSIRAAANHETDGAPTSLLPPRWMKVATIAPPPRHREDDKPLPNFTFGGTALDPPPQSPSAKRGAGPR